MSYNLANLSKEEREAEERSRREALQLHRSDERFATLADREYHRILMGRLIHKKQWVGWAQRELDDIELDELREVLRERLNAFQVAIAAPRSF
ncbi:hypothetical protein D3C76_563410 [compost metagenome]